MTVTGDPWISSANLSLNKTDFTFGSGDTPVTLRVKGTESPVTWTSANPGVAAVSAEGVVTWAGRGTTTVTAAVDGQTLECIVQEQVVLDDGRFELLLIPTPANGVELQNLIRSLLLRDFQGAGIIFRHAACVTVESEEPFPWTLDGEYAAGAEKIEIRNLERRLELGRGIFVKKDATVSFLKGAGQSAARKVLFRGTRP